jgi:hypothetical protein
VDEQGVFGDSIKAARTPARKDNSPGLELQVAPRKTATKSTTEENEGPSTPTHLGTRPPGCLEAVEDVSNEPSPTKRPTKTLLEAAIRMIQRTKKPESQKTSGTPEIVRITDLAEVVTFLYHLGILCKSIINQDSTPNKTRYQAKTSEN